jgi:hypothetical protein
MHDLLSRKPFYIGVLVLQIFYPSCSPLYIHINIILLVSTLTGFVKKRVRVLTSKIVKKPVRVLTSKIVKKPVRVLTSKIVKKRVRVLTSKIVKKG